MRSAGGLSIRSTSIGEEIKVKNGKSILSITIASLFLSSNADAEELSQRLQTLFGQGGITLAVNPANPAFQHTAHFSSSSLATLGLLAEQLAPSAADFPAISTAPGFTYKYNPDLQTFERSSTSLGSIFVERPQTVGRGKFDFGLSYLYLDFAGLNGTDLDDLEFSGLIHGDCCDPPDPFEAATATVTFDKFDLRSHVISLSGTYGITDNWDVNVLLPIFITSMDITATARINDVPAFGQQQGIHFFPNGTKQQTFSTSGEEHGVGDLQLRTKYRFYTSDSLNIASGLNLRIPTGDAANFQGLDDVILTPYIALAQDFGPINLHGSFGFDVYTETLERTRARYNVGVAYQPLDKLAFIVDMLGSSNVTDQSVSVQVPEFTGTGGSTTPSGFRTETADFRTDIVDLAVGMKFTPHQSVVGYLNVFLPLNDDGLRSEVVPAGGVQVNF